MLLKQKVIQHPYYSKLGKPYKPIPVIPHIPNWVFITLLPVMLILLMWAG